ncbi:deoxyguanosinetriphosphate triphosphohydrolase-like protein [Betaproteobacteria bacterium]|nr:deoxyguanosinetriphosphate triphosphohydrolase-like protein [Betaproteobacteria bacterium]
MESLTLELVPGMASYAVSANNSRGRRFTEPHSVYRSEFQRDRDRIIHSTAFRRLEYKTQVFVNHEGDHFRTRLTHSLEVAQIARGIARALGLNEDLTEAISLAHDLGHTPFGHAGQEALNDCMRDYGGFEHNLQSLRIVDKLEQHYASFDGLNLCFETREGILKHCSVETAGHLGDLGERFINQTQASLEAQICNLADEIAYNNHDIDDGLRSDLLSLDQLEEIALFERNWASAKNEYGAIDRRRLVHETIRRMINALVCNLIEMTKSNISRCVPRTLDDIRQSGVLVGFSEEMYDAQLKMKHFLSENLYQHYEVLRMTRKTRRIVGDLFSAFLDDPRMLPPAYRTEDNSPRHVADYIAGMTDRYAMKEHRRLFAVGEI